MRLRLDCPTPQVTEQALQEAHSETEQSTGQGPALQFNVAVRSGQGVPPLASALRTDLDLDIVPAPQVCEHKVHWLHSLTWQS